ncbi:MAG: hypothetical protein U0J65_04355 [Christensenellales bacterium]|nr:hypothetical protein [Christensenellales bacterium]
MKGAPFRVRTGCPHISDGKMQQFIYSMFRQKNQAIIRKMAQSEADPECKNQILVKKGLVMDVDLSYNVGNKNNVKGRD